MLKLIKRYKKWGYPECDYLNNALRFLMENPEKNELAIKEIYFALILTNGYFHDDVKASLMENFALNTKEK